MASAAILEAPRYTLTAATVSAGTIAVPASDALARSDLFERSTGRRLEVEVSCLRGWPVSPGLNSAISQIARLLELRAGWDSNNAKPVQREAVNGALQVLSKVLGPATPSPQVVPTVGGGLQLEWHSGGLDIEVYVDSIAGAEFFVETASGVEGVEGHLLGREDVLRSWLEKLR